MSQPLFVASRTVPAHRGESWCSERICGCVVGLQTTFFQTTKRKTTIPSRFCTRKIYIESMLRPEPARLAAMRVQRHGWPSSR